MTGSIMNTSHRLQQGVALTVALVLLVVMTLIALSAMRFSAIELRLGANDQIRVNSFEIAQSAIDASIANPGNTPVTGDVGYSVCTSGCALNTMIMPAGVLGTETATVPPHLIVTATRVAPDVSPPPRGFGFSAKDYQATNFRISSTYDRSASGQGRDQINQGVIVLVATQH